MKSAKQLSLVLMGAIGLFYSFACERFPTKVDVHLPTPSRTPNTTFTASIPTSSPSPTFTSTAIASTSALPPSPASLRVTFTYNDQLWLWQDGTAQPLTDACNCNVRISDDGEIIAFLRDGLWVINSDGSNERLLIAEDDFKSMEPRDPGVRLHEFDWIPGTHTLLFNTVLLADYGLWYTDDLYMADADILQWKMVRKAEEGGKFSVSPDGQHIVMTTPNHISLMDTDGSNYRVVLEYHVPFPSETSFYAQPTWEADSQSVTVPIPPEDFYYETLSPTVVWRLPVDGTAPTKFAELAPGDDGRNPKIWSPNKEHFVVWWEDTYQLYTDEIELKARVGTGSGEGWFTWVDEAHFIYLENSSLWLGTIGSQSILIADLSMPDSGFGSYDFAKLTQ